MFLALNSLIFTDSRKTVTSLLPGSFLTPGIRALSAGRDGQASGACVALLKFREPGAGIPGNNTRTRT